MDATFLLPEDFPGFFPESPMVISPPRITSSPRSSLSRSYSLLAVEDAEDELETGDLEAAEDVEGMDVEDLEDAEPTVMRSPLALDGQPDGEPEEGNKATKRSRVFYHRR